MQICFRHHASLDFQATAVVLKEGRGLGELTPSPRFGDAWKQPSATDVLLSLVTRSIAPGASLVHAAIAPASRPIGRPAAHSFAPFVEHDDDEVQQFGAELFGGSRGLDKLPIPSWLSLLQTKSPSALAAICDVMVKHVVGTIAIGPVHRAGLCSPDACRSDGARFSQARTISTGEDRDAISAVAARCAALGSELATWALAHFGTPQTYDRELISRFLIQVYNRFAARHGIGSSRVRPASKTRYFGVDWLRRLMVATSDCRLWTS